MQASTREIGTLAQASTRIGHRNRGCKASVFQYNDSTFGYYANGTDRINGDRIFAEGDGFGSIDAALTDAAAAIYTPEAVI